MRNLAILCIFFAAFLTSCQQKKAATGPTVQKIDSEELARIVINFATKMKIDKHLELEDSWASYNGNILNVCLQFSSQRLLTVYDARLLMVEVVEEFLWRLNNNSIVSFELDHFPFTANDIDVKINFESFYGLFVDEVYVGLACLQGGCVHFYGFDHKDRSLNGIDWDHHRFEPYTKSKQLALLKKAADLPYIEYIGNPQLPGKSDLNSSSERYHKLEK